jgi:hypothetical protein
MVCSVVVYSVQEGVYVSSNKLMFQHLFSRIPCSSPQQELFSKSHSKLPQNGVVTSELGEFK